jgi:hypothetical protein
MEDSSMTQSITQAKGMRTLLRQGHRLVVPRQPLVRIAKPPQRPGGTAEANHASVLPIEERRGAVLLGVVERHTLRKVCVCKGWRSQVEQRRPQGTVRCHEHCGVLGLLRQGQELLTQGVGRL